MNDYRSVEDILKLQIMQLSWLMWKKRQVLRLNQWHFQFRKHGQVSHPSLPKWQNSCVQHYCLLSMTQGQSVGRTAICVALLPPPVVLGWSEGKDGKSCKDVWTNFVIASSHSAFFHLQTLSNMPTSVPSQ